MKIFSINPRTGELFDILDISNFLIPEDAIPSKNKKKEADKANGKVTQMREIAIQYIGMAHNLYSDEELEAGFTIDFIQETAKIQRANAGVLHKHATQGASWAETLEQAIAERDRIMALLPTITFEEIKPYGDNMGKLIKVIDSEGKIGFTKGDDGKITLKGSGTRSGNGERSNPLPPIEDVNWIMRGNGTEKAEAVLMVKTDVLAGTGKKKDDLFAPGQWQAFHKAKGEGEKFSNWGSLGKTDGLAYSTLNVDCNTRVMGNDGTSVGTGGLKTVELDEVVEILTQAGFELA